MPHEAWVSVEARMAHEAMSRHAMPADGRTPVGAGMSRDAGGDSHAVSRVECRTAQDEGRRGE